MNNDPLLSDDLKTLLGRFPNDALRDLVGILKQQRAFFPYPNRRAEAAHAVHPSGDLTPHVAAIAEEILWWGSHGLDFMAQGLPRWVDILMGLANHAGAKIKDSGSSPTAWALEDAIFCHVLASWDQMSSDQREAAVKKAGVNFKVLQGGAMAAVGFALRMAVPDALALGAVPVGAIGAALVGPLLGGIGLVWAGYKLSGPSYRVLYPITLTIADHRWRLRDARMAAAFRD